MAMQGDSFYLPIVGSGFSMSDIDKFEFVIGPLRKEYPGEVIYDSVNSRFMFPLSQEETYMMCGPVHGQVRLKYKDSGGVIGATLGTFDVKKSMVRTVL